MSDPVSGVDERLVRVEHGVVAVLLLGGYVFRSWYVVPLVAVPLLLRAAAPGGFDWIDLGASRVSRFASAAPLRRVDAGVVRSDALLGGLALVVATICFAGDVSWLGWIVAVAVAVVSAVRAATGASVSRGLSRRRSR